MSYRNSFHQNTVYETFVNTSNETIPAFGCVPFEYSMDGRSGRMVTRLDEAKQDHALLGFNGPQSVRPGKPGQLTQHWPAVASVPKTFGPIEVGARLGPVAGEWDLRWGTAFYARGMLADEDGERLVWVYPAQAGYAGPGFQVQGGPLIVPSGDHVTFTGSTYTVSALSAAAVRDNYAKNFASDLLLQSAYSNEGSELVIPRRGRYLVAFNGMCYSDTGLTTETDLSFRWRVRTVANDYHLSALMGYGTTKLDEAEDYYSPSRQKRTQIGISGTLALRHGFAISLQNTSNVTVVIETFVVSVIHIGAVSEHNVCPWEDALWL